MRPIDEIDKRKLRRLIEQKGKRAALLDAGARPLLSEAGRKDIARKGLLQAIADCCVVIMDTKAPYYLTKDEVIEVLRGCIDGMEHVGG